MLKTSKSWESWHYSSKNIFRKEERDWAMVYLARAEDTDEAIIEWKFDFTVVPMSIEDVKIRFDTKLYESAKVDLKYLNEKG